VSIAAERSRLPKQSGPIRGPDLNSVRQKSNLQNVGAIVLGCAIFLIVELSQPYGGFIRLPTGAIETVIKVLGE
jgi:hypothetical protein